MQDIKNYTMIICFLVFSIFNEYLFYANRFVHPNEEKASKAEEALK